MCHVHLKGVCILLLLDGLFYVYIYYIQIVNVLFKTNVSLLIICLDDLSIGESGMLKVPYYDCVTVDFPFYGC